MPLLIVIVLPLLVWIAVNQNNSAVWISIGLLSITVFAFTLSETALPIVLLLTLALGSLYNWTLAQKSFYVRFLFLTLIVIRGGLFLYQRNRSTLPQARFRPTLLHTLFFVIALFGLLSSFISVNPLLSAQRAISFFMLEFVIFVYFWQRTTEPLECENYALALWKSFVIILTVGYIFLLLRVPGMYYVGRMRLVLGNPNDLGHYCALMAPLVIWVFFEKPTHKFVKWGTVAMLLVTIVLAGSRSALAAAFLALTLQFFLCYRKKLLGLIFCAGLVVAVHSAIDAYSPQPMDRDGVFKEVILRENTLTTASGRVAIWKIGWKLLKDRPYLGYGFGTVDYLFKQKIFPEVPGFQGENAHNSYLETLLNIGWIGAAPVFLALIYLLKLGATSLFVRNTFTSKYRFTCALFCIIVTGVILCVSESWLLSVGSVFCFPYWLSCALFLRMVYHFNDWQPA